MLKTKTSQIWVETVTYTLIGLSIVALLLVALKPTIESTRDKITTEQIIDALNRVDEKVEGIKTSPGNKRSIILKVSKGNLLIDAINERISWVFNSKYQYSESGTLITLPGSMRILTESKAEKDWVINITLEYSDRPIDLKYNNESIKKTLNYASIPYNLYVENLGLNSDNKTIINIVHQ